MRMVERAMQHGADRRARCCVEGEKRRASSAGAHPHAILPVAVRGRAAGQLRRAMRSAAALRAAVPARPAPPPPPRRALPPCACRSRASRRAGHAVAPRRRVSAAAEAEAQAAAASEERAFEPPRLLVAAARDAPLAPSAEQLQYFNRFASVRRCRCCASRAPLRSRTGAADYAGWRFGHRSARRPRFGRGWRVCGRG